MNVLWYHRWRLLTSLIVVALLQRLSSPARAAETQWFKLDGMPEPSAGLEVDGSTENINVGGSKTTYDTLFITPTVGLKGSGSVYHPNLLTFDFNTEFGWEWDWLSTSAPGYNRTIDENGDLSRYQLNVHLLDSKPYNATFTASKDHTYRDYGSFQTFEVDIERYDGHMVWDKGNNQFNLDFGCRDETDAGLVDSSEVREKYMNFFGVNHRRAGQTTVIARWDMFDNILNFGTVSSESESAGISDVENFGAHNQITAATGVSVSHSEYGSQQTDGVHGNGNLTVHHTPTLESFLVVNYDYNQMHPATESVVQGSAGVRHQLYESLTSTLDGHGSYQQNDSGIGSSGTTDRYGVGLAEGYSKRLQSWGRLTINGSLLADHEDDQSNGSFATTIDEAHQLYLTTSPQYHPVYLNRPRVVAGSVQVTSGGQALILGTDYEVITSGELSEVRLIVPASSHLQTLLGSNDNLPVLVTYTSESQNNAAYEELTGNAQIRLDLPAGFGVYGRLGWMDNNAPSSVLTQTLMDLVGGADYTWHWFRAGGEYEDYDSNFSKYNALRFFQNLDFRLSQRSSLSVSFNETFYHYAVGGDQNLYQAIARYNVQLWSSLAWYVQGGCSWQDIGPSEQLQGSAQTGLNWTRGKLSARVGYEYNNQSLKSGGFTEDRDKNRFFVYLKRTF